MSGRMSGKIVILAGGGASGPGWGIGKACAAVYAREGASVFVVDRDGAAAAETVATIEREGGTAVAAVADLTESADVARMVEACVRRFGRIDVLHNNVAITKVGGPAELSLDDWDLSWKVNVTSLFLACKHALPVMEAGGGGAVVNIASVAASRYLGVPYTAYYTTKAAVVQFTKVIAVQYATRGIRSNAVSPCFVTGPNSNRFLVDHDGDPDVLRFSARRAEQAPMKRLATGFDVAHAALYLASDEAGYVTGTELVVDGGVSAAAVF